MNTLSSKEYTVLPRPAERLPDYAHAKSRQVLAEKMVEAFRLSQAAAAAISNAVVDPAAVRKSINDPAAPTVNPSPSPAGRFWAFGPRSGPAVLCRTHAIPVHFPLAVIHLPSNPGQALRIPSFDRCRNLARR